MSRYTPVPSTQVSFAKGEIEQQLRGFSDYRRRKSSEQHSEAPRCLPVDASSIPCEPRRHSSERPSCPVPQTPRHFCMQASTPACAATPRRHRHRLCVSLSFLGKTPRTGVFSACSLHLVAIFGPDMVCECRHALSRLIHTYRQLCGKRADRRHAKVASDASALRIALHRAQRHNRCGQYRRNGPAKRCEGLPSAAHSLYCGGSSVGGGGGRRGAGWA